MDGGGGGGGANRENKQIVFLLLLLLLLLGGARERAECLQSKHAPKVYVFFFSFFCSNCGRAGGIEE